MKIGIMGAMPEEVDGIRAVLENVSSQEIGGRTYWIGHCQGVEIVLVYSRCGKVSSAAAAAVLLDRFEVAGIFFIGIAGAVHPDLKFGDVVVADELVQHDMDASALPMFERFEIPLLGRSRFTGHADWVALARQESERYFRDEFAGEFSPDTLIEFGITKPKTTVGLIASGDQFVNDSDVVAGLRAALPGLLCLEMEGAAVAQICHEFDRPCLVVRVISDLADHSAVVDFQKFLRRVASPITCCLASRIIPILAQAAKKDLG